MVFGILWSQHFQDLCPTHNPVLMLLRNSLNVQDHFWWFLGLLSLPRPFFWGVLVGIPHHSWHPGPFLGGFRNPLTSRTTFQELSHLQGHVSGFLGTLAHFQDHFWVGFRHFLTTVDLPRPSLMVLGTFHLPDLIAALSGVLSPPRPWFWVLLRHFLTAVDLPRPFVVVLGALFPLRPFFGVFRNSLTSKTSFWGRF